MQFKHRAALLLSCLLLSFVLISGCEQAESRTKFPQDEGLVAMVNGEKIYDSELRAALEALQNENLSYGTILSHSISDLIVVQMAPHYGISSSKEEEDTFLSSHQTLILKSWKRAVHSMVNAPIWTAFCVCAPLIW